MLTGQSLNICGWLSLTIDKEMEKKKIARATYYDLICAKITTLKSIITATDRASASAVPPAIESLPSTHEFTASMVDEFARAISVRKGELWSWKERPCA